MAFGDSITAGVGANGAKVVDGGYRGTLATLLAENGYHARFVGSRNDYADALDERAHEGWPGYVVRSFASDPGPGQLYGRIARAAIRDGDPDVILLMAGTNDLLRLEKHAPGYTLPNIVQSMDLLLDEMLTEKPSVHVIVAPVVASPRIDACALAAFNGSDDACGATLTQNVKTLVASYAKRGYHVTFAERMGSAVPRDRDHFPDGIHPCGAGGYAAIANVWFEAIKQIAEGSAEAPVAKR